MRGWLYKQCCWSTASACKPETTGVARQNLAIANVKKIKYPWQQRYPWSREQSMQGSTQL